MDRIFSGRLLPVLFAVLIASGPACTLTNSASQREMEAAISDFRLPVPAKRDKALVFFVNPYVSRCCGATGGTDLLLRNSAGQPFVADKLIPIDDFRCAYLDPGNYTVTAGVPGFSREIRDFRFDAGQIHYVAIETNFKKNGAVSIRATSETEGLYHIYKTQERMLANPLFSIKRPGDQERNDRLVARYRVALSEKYECRADETGGAQG